jgi:hypothetical protein
VDIRGGTLVTFKVDLGGKAIMPKQRSDAPGQLQAADSDEVAWAILDDVARAYEMISPGCVASLA